MINQKQTHLERSAGTCNKETTLNIMYKPNTKITVQEIIYKLIIKKKGSQGWGKEAEIGTPKSQ